MPADEEDHHPEHRAEEESDPPRVADGEVVDHEQGEDRAEERPAPVGAVDGDVHPPPVLGRDQFVDGRVDGGVLAADARAGHEPRQVEPVDPERRVPEGQRRQEPAEEVDAEGDHEQVASAPPVRQSAEEERAEHLTEQVDGPDGERHTGRRQVQRLLAADQAGDVRLAIVISRPSSTQATPRATTSIVWNRDQPSRSRRAGTSVRIVPPPESPAATCCSSTTVTMSPFCRLLRLFPRWMSANRSSRVSVRYPADRPDRRGSMTPAGPSPVEGARMANGERIDLTDPDLFADGPPHDVYRRLRDEVPVFWHGPTPTTPGGEGFWCLTRHEDVSWAARRPALFSSVGGGDRDGAAP